MKRVREYVSGEILMLLYRRPVEPYLRCCNTTWGYCGVTRLDTLQALQNRAARVIMPVLCEAEDGHNGFHSVQEL